MAHVTANGLNIFYQLHGQGEPLLFLHGFGGTGHSDWKHQIPILAQRFQLVVPDLRGHGRTDHPETITGPEFFDIATADMAELCSSLNLGRVHVCGYSMGASIATSMYLHYPEMVASLILVSGAARLNRDIAPQLFELWERLAEPDRIEAGWARMLAQLHGEDKWRVLLRNYSVAVLARVGQDEDILQGRAGEIAAPTLIVQGTEDSVSPGSLSVELHDAIDGSELVPLQSDHWVPGLKPDEFDAAVLEFLTRRSSLQLATRNAHGSLRMNKPTRLLVATRNEGKLKEYEQLLAGLPVVLTYLTREGVDHDVEEAGSTFAENAVHKAEEYARISGLLTLADDSGLEVDALGGEPGVRSARYAGPGATDEDRYRLLLERMRDIPEEKRSARFRCVVAVAEPGGRTFTAEGVCEGAMTFKPAGSHGFGYDPVFFMPEYGKTMAQLPTDTKNRVSHRGRAAQGIRPVLEKLAGR